MMDHVGKICQFYLELLFKHSLGRWDLLGVDEAATGQAKKSPLRKNKATNKERFAVVVVYTQVPGEF